MKLCFGISTPSAAGGANRSLIDLIRALRVRDASFSAIALMSAHGSMEEALQSLGVRVYVVPFANAAKSRNPVRTLGKRVYNVFAKPKLMRILKSEGVTLLHNNSLPSTLPMEAAYALGIPYLCHIRENVWDGLGMRLYGERRVQRIVERASRVVYISKYIQSVYAGFASDAKGIVLPDGVDARAYETARTLSLKPPVMLLMVGVINPQKGQLLAVLAAKQLKDEGIPVRLGFVGAKGRWQESTAFADAVLTEAQKQLGDDFTYYGAIDEEAELQRIRREYEINLVCSSAEGLGRTTIEGMLAGMLTVAANAGATPELIRDGETGLLYDGVGGVKAIVERIRWAIGHPEQAAELAGNGQIFARERFAIGTYAEAIASLYRETESIGS